MSPVVQGGSNMTGTNCDLFTHNQSRSYLNHLVVVVVVVVVVVAVTVVLTIAIVVVVVVYLFIRSMIK
jgi:hypothetical protein